MSGIFEIPDSFGNSVLVPKCHTTSKVPNTSLSGKMRVRTFAARSCPKTDRKVIWRILFEAPNSKV
jgi:hypothetical protein